MTQKSWKNPQAACSFMSHISGLQTGGYKSSEIEGEFFCCSPYKELGKEFPSPPNNIAYYVEGNAQEARLLKLVLSSTLSIQAA